VIHRENCISAKIVSAILTGTSGHQMYCGRLLFFAVTLSKKSYWDVSVYTNRYPSAKRLTLRTATSNLPKL
jgi:hypothetical protein